MTEMTDTAWAFGIDTTNICRIWYELYKNMTIDADVPIRIFTKIKQTKKTYLGAAIALRDYFPPKIDLNHLEYTNLAETCTHYRWDTLI